MRTLHILKMMAIQWPRLKVKEKLSNIGLQPRDITTKKAFSACNILQHDSICTLGDFIESNFQQNLK